jgi:enamine deaminase RidA (YjgF/YER057c/UK114 family)
MSEKKNIYSTKYPSKYNGFPSATKANGLVFISGVGPSYPDISQQGFSNIPKEGRNKSQHYSFVDEIEGKVASDSWVSHANMDGILLEAGSGGDQILRQHVWQKDKRFFPVYEDVRQVVQKVPSPSSGLGVLGLYGNQEYTIGIDAIAVCPGENPDLDAREVLVKLDDKNLPSASFYSQAVKSGPMVFTAGHIPIKTSEEGMPLVNSYKDINIEGRFLETGRSHPDSRDGPIAAQSWYVYNELKRTLESQGLDLSDTVNSTVFLADVRDYPTFHRIHKHFFPKNGPALTVSGFEEVGHRGCLLEIELTAVGAHNNFTRTQVEWSRESPFAAPSAVKTGKFVFYSGILGLDQQNKLVSEVNDLNSIANFKGASNNHSLSVLELQCWAALDLLSKVSADAGSDISNLVKLSIYVKNPSDFEVFSNVVVQFMEKTDLPAVECIIIPNPGPVKEALVQIEAIGII